MKRARRVVTPPVCDAVGSIGGLLHLPDEEPWQEGMQAARRHIKHVTTLNGVMRE
jgi:hypothetical protein